MKSKLLAGEYFDTYAGTEVTVEYTIDGDGYILYVLSNGKIIWADGKINCEIKNYKDQEIIWSDYYETTWPDGRHRDGPFYKDGSEIEWGNEV